jgi:MtN3 and saliva related transmembrane protein
LPVLPFTLSPLAIEVLGFTAAAFTTFCWLPQALRTIRTRDTRAISLLTNVAFAIGIVLWLGYGLLIASWPVILSNVISFMLVSVIIAMKLRYG